MVAWSGTTVPAPREPESYLSLELLEEYYSVIAHQISALGVQATAARTATSKSPEAAREVLESLESGARALSMLNTYLLRYLEESWGQWLQDHNPSSSEDSCDSHEARN